MASVWGELRRRNVFKVAVAYAILAWLLIQVADIVFPVLKLPEWTLALVTVLLFLLFPMALLMAWAYELTPEGFKPTSEVPLSHSVRKITGRKIEFIIIGPPPSQVRGPNSRRMAVGVPCATTAAMSP